MTDPKLLAQLLHDTYSGSSDHKGYAWHGDPLLAILKGVSAKQAATKPKGASHSIWELVLHIANWEEITLRRLKGEKVEWLQDSPVDWPRVTATSEVEWKQTLK